MFESDLVCEYACDCVYVLFLSIVYWEKTCFILENARKIDIEAG